MPTLSFKKTPLASALTFARASIATGKDWESKLRTVAANEPVYVGSRRVENLLISPADFADVDWKVFGATKVGATTIDGVDCMEIAFTGAAGDALFQNSILADVNTDGAMLAYVRAKTSAVDLRLNLGGNTADSSPDINVPTSWTLIGHTRTATHTNVNTVSIRNGSGGAAISFYVAYAQVEDVTAQSNKNPSSFVDGVAVYDTLNANTVDSDGVVTERVGCNIDQFKNLDGSNDYLTIPDWSGTVDAVIEFDMYLTDSAGSRYVMDRFVGGAQNFNLRVDSGDIKDSISSTIEVNGDSSPAISTGRWYHVKLSGFANTVQVGVIGATESGGSVFSGAIANVLLLSGDGSDDRFYKLDELTGTVAVDSTSGQNGTYVNMTDPLPLLPAVMQGITVEPASTNALTYSEEFDNAAYSVNGVSVTANAAVAPDGASTMDNLIESAAAGVHQLFRSVTLTASTGYALTFFVKANGRTRLRLLTTSPGMTNAEALYDLSAVTATAVLGGVSQGIVDCGGGIYRVNSVFEAVTGGSSTIRLQLDNGSGSSYTGDGTSGVLAWGAQLEEGSYPTSYIKTEATTETRARVDLSGTLQDFTSNVTGNVQFSVPFGPTDDKGSNVRIWRATGDTADDRLEQRLGQTTGTISTEKDTSGGTARTATLTPTTPYTANTILSVDFSSTEEDGISVTYDSESATNTTDEAKDPWTTPVENITFGNVSLGGAAPISMNLCEFSYNPITDGAFMQNVQRNLMRNLMRPMMR